MIRRIACYLIAARRLLSSGEGDTMAVLEAHMRFLGGSDAEMVLVNLEDLWLEREPQNVPAFPIAVGGSVFAPLLGALDQARRMADGNER
jgi:hypothetical protein